MLLDRKLMRQAHHHHTALAIDITDFVGRRLGVVHRIRYPRRRRDLCFRRKRDCLGEHGCRY